MTKELVALAVSTLLRLVLLWHAAPTTFLGALLNLNRSLSGVHGYVTLVVLGGFLVLFSGFLKSLLA
jgi:hypothetical protein